MTTTDLSPIKAQVTKLENQANQVVISNQDDYVKGVDLVSKLKETGNLIKEKKESITKPLNEALKNARSLFAPIEMQFDNAERIVKSKLLEYKQKKDTEARAEEARIAARVEKGTLKLETAERKIQEVERVDTTTRGNRGEVQTRKIKKVRIVNEASIPREYLIPDMVKIRKDALAGIVINGTEVYEEESLAVGTF